MSFNNRIFNYLKLKCPFSNTNCIVTKMIFLFLNSILQINFVFLFRGIFIRAEGLIPRRLRRNKGY